MILGGFPAGSDGKESACNAGDPGLILGSGRSAGEGIGYPLQYCWASLVAQLVIRLQRRRPGFDPRVGKIPWRRERLPTPVFLPGESSGLYRMGSQRVGHDLATKDREEIDHFPPKSKIHKNQNFF